MSIFGTKSVDTIMARFTKTVAELQDHAEAQDAEYSKQETVERAARENKLLARGEASKARTMATRLNDLFT